MWRTTCSSSDTSFFTGVVEVEQARVDFAVWQHRMEFMLLSFAGRVLLHSFNVFEVVSLKLQVGEGYA